MKTGDQISPPDGYVGGGLQMQVDIEIDQAGNIWAGNNWHASTVASLAPTRGSRHAAAGKVL
jgi:hypothetical protein